MSTGLYLVSWALHQLGARAGIIELDFTVWKCSWGCVTCCYQGGSWHYHITSIPPRSPHPSNADHNPDHKTGESRTNNLGKEDYYHTCGLSSRRVVSLKWNEYIYLICTELKKKLAHQISQKYTEVHTVQKWGLKTHLLLHISQRRLLIKSNRLAQQLSQQPIAVHILRFCNDWGLWDSSPARSTFHLALSASWGDHGHC